MNKKSDSVKKLSNATSTGGAGTNFENRVQTAYAVLMLTDGLVPTKIPYPINKIQLQAKKDGFDVDDMVVYTEDPITKKQSKILCQIKLSISINKSDKNFQEFIVAAWNDFNKKDLFNENTDAIALITGPLAEIDTIHTRKLLRQAREAIDAQDFKTRIDLVKFTSKQQRDKLNIIKSLLKVANGNVDVSDDELWRFSKIFYILIYDLDEKISNMLCLFQTILNQEFENDCQDLWDRINGYISYSNENAGLLTKKNILENITNITKKEKLKNKIPENLEFSYKINQVSNIDTLAIAALVGSWNENYETDKEIVAKIACESYDIFIKKLRNILIEKNVPLSFSNGIWNIKDRKNLLNDLANNIFDDNLEQYKLCVITVLSERDPKFELAKEDRYAADIYNKKLKYSYSLRKGLAQGLILLDLFNDAFINCSLNKAKSTSASTLREIFKNNDWLLWGSLNDLLPFLAEASPDIFLEIVDNALNNSQNPYSVLFKEESSALTGSNYLTGLLWALEIIAWEENYLIQVTPILAELSTIDPGGNWANRPINSLITIFLPWLPQTMASIDIRIKAIEILKKSYPNIAWNLVLNLLPSRTQTSMGSYKPIYKNNISNDNNQNFSDKEYWEQISSYLEIIIELAKDDIAKLNELIEYIPSMPEKYLNQFLDYLVSENILALVEEERLSLWNNLNLFILKHKRFIKEDWAINSELILKIESIVKKLEPQNPLNLYKPLFSEDDNDFYDELNNGNRKEQSIILQDKRKEALESIISYGNFNALQHLINIVKYPYKVGACLSKLTNYNFDSDIFPKMLNSKNTKIQQFISYYTLNKFHNLGWEWIDSIDMNKWSINQITEFYISLPFDLETWKQVEKIFKDKDAEYWKNVIVNPYQSNLDLDYAINKLIEYDRPHAAIDCICCKIHNKQPFNTKSAVSALFAAVNSKESLNSMDTYHILQLIKELQKDNMVNKDDLLRIEWSYLSVINSPGSGINAITLENELANNPEFFCEIMQLLYKSKKENIISDKKYNKEAAKNAWKLLHDWHTPPGMQEDGSFDDEKLKTWYKEVKQKCEVSGHLEVALIHIGNVLFYCFETPNGFTINKTAAQIINGIDAEKIRNGYYSEIINSRGVYFVNPSGEDETKLAEKYREQADKIQYEGYTRFAAMLKKVSDSYEDEAKRVISEHKQGDED